jgi:glycosyltransferase involved in cell wall biosynthesis
MRILVLAPFDLFPPVHGGSTAVYNFVRNACRRHEMTALISHLYSQGGPVDLPVDRVHVRYCPPSAFDWLRVLSFPVNPHYYRAAEHAFQEAHPDLVQSEVLWTMPAGWRLRRRHRVPLVWVEQNIEARKYSDLGHHPILVAAVRQLERSASRHADHIVVLSDSDRQSLVQQYGVPAERISVIAPGPDLADFGFDPAARDRVRKLYGLANGDPLLTFVGNLEYGPNQLAVRYIAEDVYPAIMARHPEARFVVIGQSWERLAQHQRDRLTFTGYLSRQELVAHLCATDVFLVPVETGSGVRIKIPEATACGRAVLATNKSAQGLEMFGEDELIRVAGVGAQFVNTLMQLIENPQWREEIGQRGQARTEKEFGWEKALAAYEAVYAKLGALRN